MQQSFEFYLNYNASVVPGIINSNGTNRKMIKRSHNTIVDRNNLFRNICIGMFHKRSKMGGLGLLFGLMSPFSEAKEIMVEDY